MTDPLEDYWADLRQGIPKPKRVFPGTLESLPQLLAWAKTPRDPFRVLPGDDRKEALARLTEDRGALTFWANPWGRDPVATSLVHLLRDISIHPTRRMRPAFSIPLPLPRNNLTGWDLLWGLVARKSFVIEEPLRGLIDRRFSRLSDMFRALTEVRFEISERKGGHLIEEAVTSIGRWVEGSPKIDPFLQQVMIRRPLNEEEKLGVLFFLLTLAKQNGLVEDTIFVLGDLENADRKEAGDLHRVLSALERWGPIGCPFRLLITWDGRSQNALRRLHPGLSKQVREGLSWIR